MVRRRPRSHPQATDTDSAAPIGWRLELASLFGAQQLVTVAVAYFLAMLGYHLDGLRFGIGAPDTVSQFVESDLLRHDYFRSLWYLHSQPPLFNAWMGAVQKWSPLSDGLTYHLTFLAAGLVLAYSLMAIARVIGAGRWTATGIGVVVAVAPPVVMFQHWFFYDYPMAVLVSATLAAFGLWARTRRIGFAALAMMCGGAAVLTRSMMHPLWLVAMGVAVWCAQPRDLRPPAERQTKAERHQPIERRRLLVVVAVPLVLVGALMIKNQVLFGTSQLSSWFGFNLYRTTVLAQPEPVQREWRSKYDLPGILPEPCELAHPDVPVLAERYKSPEVPNWNWECTLPMFDRMQAVSTEIIREEPGKVARGVVGSMEIWFSTNDYWVGVTDRRQEIEVPSRVWRNAIGWDVAWDPPVETSQAFVALGPDFRNHLSLTAVWTSLVVYGAGAWAVGHRWRSRRDERTAQQVAGRARDLLLVAVAGTVGMSFLVGTLFEHGENARFRFVTEPLTLATAAAVVAVAVSGLVARRRVAASSGEGLVR